MRYLYLFVILALCSCSKKIYEVGKIQTEKGEILIWLHKETPNHKASFIKLAKKGYWNDYTFNRVIPNFVAQAGCPDTPEGFNDTKYLLKPEFHENLKHIYGAVGAGRDDNPEKLSASCQFYIVQNKNGLERLDTDYTIFGQVIKGMDLVDDLVNVKRDTFDAPISPIKINVTIVKMKASYVDKLISKTKINL